MELEENELSDPTPDICDLFCHYDSLYFGNCLGACIVSWSSRITSCTGTCRYDPGGGCEILLSEPLLKYRSITDLKNTLLHEMIHAFLWIKYKNKDHRDHGSRFQDKMNEINSSLVIDHQKPHSGYNITLCHDFKKEASDYVHHHWKCDTCGDLIKRTASKEPSASDCKEKRGHDRSCGNPSCCWHSHRSACPGNYLRVAELPGCKDKKVGLTGEEELQYDKKSKVPYLTRQSTRKSYETETVKLKSDSKKAIIEANHFPSDCEAKGNSGNNISSNDDSKKELYHEELIGINLKTQSEAMAPEVLKAVNPPASKRKHKCSSKKRRRDGKLKTVYKSVGKWFKLYGDDEEEEEVEPLINKRSERRKREKLLKIRQEQGLGIEDIGDDRESRPGVSIDHNPMDADSGQVPVETQRHAEDGLCIGAAEAMDCPVDSKQAHDRDTSFPSNVRGGHKDVKNQVGSCDDASRLSSSIGEEIVEISDG